MQWNMEPMGGVDPQSVPAGVAPTPMNAWGARIMDLAGQGARGVQAAGEGLRQVQQMTPEGMLDAAGAQRQLRQERARQWYERTFGMSRPGQESLASMGQQEEVDALLRRVHYARQMHGYIPGTGYIRR